MNKKKIISRSKQDDPQTSRSNRPGSDKAIEVSFIHIDISSDEAP